MILAAFKSKKSGAVVRRNGIVLGSVRKYGENNYTI